MSTDQLEPALETHFAAPTVDASVARLLDAGVGAHAVRGVPEAMESEWLASRGISITREHDGPGRVRTTGPSPMLSRTPVRPGAPASAPGADGPAILEELGLGDRRTALLGTGAVVDSL